MKNGILYIADPNEGGGGAGIGAAALGNGSVESTQQTPAAEPAAAETTPATEPTPQITPESLAKAMKDAGVGVQQPVQPQQQYTQEDFDRAFQVVRPTKDQLTKILAGGDEAILALTEVLHATARQGVVMSAYQIAEAVAKLEGRLTPVEQWRNERAEAELKQEFITQNKDLEKFTPMLETIAADMKQKGISFKTKDEAFKAVRETAVKMIKTILPDWKPGQEVQQAQSSKASMPTLARGGGSGGASASQGKVGGASSKSPGMAIFGEQ